jgi:isocitrate dehydrogenase
MTLVRRKNKSREKVTKLTHYNMITLTLAHFRYSRQFKYIATEVLNKDVFSLKKGKFYEYEVKTSYSDFKADFKKRKHKSKNKSTNYFNYVVSEEIADKVLSYIKDNYDNYGVIVCKNVKQNKRSYKIKTDLRVLKQAKFMELGWNKKTLKKSIVQRMSSEIVIARQKKL